MLKNQMMKTASGRMKAAVEVKIAISKATMKYGIMTLWNSIKSQNPSQTRKSQLKNRRIPE